MKKLILIPAILLVLFSCTKETATVANSTTNNQDAADELTALAASPSTASLVNELPTANKPGDTMHHPCKLKHPGIIEGEKVEFTSLPQTIQDYITTNNGGSANVELALKITLKDNKVIYVVRLLDKKHIHFDANGNKLERPEGDRKFERIALTDLPAAATTYLNANVDSSLILGAVKMLNKNGDVCYGVRLKNNEVYTFDASGNFTGTHQGKPLHK